MIYARFSKLLADILIYTLYIFRRTDNYITMSVSVETAVSLPFLAAVAGGRMNFIENFVVGVTAVMLDN